MCHPRVTLRTSVPHLSKAPGPSDEPLNKHTHGENIVQFYDTPEYILNVLTNFIVPILSTKDAAVIVAVKDRLEAVEMRLRRRGRKGQLSLIDAHGMLDKLSNFDDWTPISIESVDLLLLRLDNKFAKSSLQRACQSPLCTRESHLRSWSGGNVEWSHETVSVYPAVWV